MVGMDREELRRRIAQHPNAVTIRELQGLLEAYGWTLERVRGSHHIFTRGRDRLTVPYRRPHVLAVYVKRVLTLTEEVET
jgi:predicted RNA binding protein YcfA (HicA-like mRNA interferase family)